MFFTSKPKYSWVPDQYAGKLFKISEWVFIKLKRRVVCDVRVITSRITPDGCSGSNYAGLDVFVAHGLAVTPFYYWQKAGRFNGAFISDTRHDIFIDFNAAHEREAFLPACMSEGVSVYKNTTHLHLITAHINNWQNDMPHEGELFHLDLYFVDVIQIIDGEESKLTNASSEFGTLKCPFVIHANHIKELEIYHA